MQKFEFKYDTILKIKEIFEKKILKEISDLEKEIDKLNNYKHKISDKKKKLAQKITQGKIKIIDYKSAKSLCKTLEKEISNIQKKIDELILLRRRKFDELLEKKKEKKIFETLKDRQYEEYLIETNRKDIKHLNEIAINNYNRKEQ